MSEKQKDGLQFEPPYKIRERYKKLTEDDSFAEQMIEVLTKLLEKHPVKRLPGWEPTRENQ